MVYKFFDKNSVGSGVNTHSNKSDFNNEKQLNNYTKKFVDNLKKSSLFRIQRQYLGADLADMQ